MSGASRLANNLYKFKKLDFLSTEGANLPECYKNFYREWKMTTPSPVHYIPPAAEWERNPLTGEVKRVPNIPIPVKYVPESHLGIWGGEGVVKGFQKRHPQKARVTHYWVPNLRKSAVYSEILDKTMELTVTSRTIDLIIDNFGFDHYILKTKACDLQSGLALKLKQKMLDALYNKSLYPNDPVKRERVFEKYKNYLEPYSAEDIEWYGLTPDEALVKYKALEAERSNKGPLKHELRKKYIEYLMKKSTEKEPEEEEKPSTSSSWVSKLNPFASKS